MRRKKLKLTKLSHEDKFYECSVNGHKVGSYYYSRYQCRTCHPVINGFLELPSIVITGPLGALGIWFLAQSLPLWMAIAVGVIATIWLNFSLNTDYYG